MSHRTRGRGQLLRFAIAGCLNTLVTGVCLALLSRVIHPKLAYTIVFALGLTASTLLASKFVFRSILTPSRAIRFCVVYLSVYTVGLTVLDALPTRLPGGHDARAAAVVAITAPLSFLGGRLVFRRPSYPDSAARGASS